MRLSARQAWHDCFYVPKNDALARVRELTGKSGQLSKPRGSAKKIGGKWMMKIWEPDPDNPLKNGEPGKRAAYLPMLSAPGEKPKFRDFFLSWDPLWRGKVAGAIKRLPPILRAFGMMMYAPKPEITLDHAELVVEAIKLSYFDAQKAEDLKSWRGSRIVRVHYMIHAALQFYRQWIFGGGDYTAKPKQVGDWIHEQFKDRIPHIEDHWQRDWESTWTALITIIDELEAQALTPVAKVLSTRVQKVEECPQRSLEEPSPVVRPVICGPKKLISLDDLPRSLKLKTLSIRRLG